MGINTNWQNEEKTIILQVYEKKWSSQDFVESVSIIYKLMGSVPHTVHTISDLSQTTVPPAGIITSLPTIERQVPSNRGLNIVVGGNHMLEGVYHVGKKIVPFLMRNTVFAKTREEAFALIRNHDPIHHHQSP